jgi:hypothetical protein
MYVGSGRAARKLMSGFPTGLRSRKWATLFRPGAAVLNRTLENAWREISPYLDEALDLNGAARECWLVDLDRRAPETAAAVRAWLAQLTKLKEQDFLGAAVTAAIYKSG